GDFPAALQASERALVLDPEDEAARVLEEQARTVLEAAHIKEWVADARLELERGALTAASLLVDRALSLNSSSPEALVVRRAIDEARAELARAEERTQQVKEMLGRARKALDAGHLTTALRVVNEALAIDDTSSDAKSLKGRIAAAIEA